jgi:hypothetical protein
MANTTTDTAVLRGDQADDHGQRDPGRPVAAL